MSAFVVELEGREADVHAWVSDVSTEPHCTLQRTRTLWRVARFAGDGDDVRVRVRVRVHLSGPDAPLLVGKAAIQDLLAVSRRTVRREAVGGSLLVPPPPMGISLQDLREELLRIGAQDTASTATRLVDALDALDAAAEASGGPPDVSAVRKVARLVIRVARDAEDHDRRFGIDPSKREPADLMWSALADRLEAIELQRVGMGRPDGTQEVPSC